MASHVMSVCMAKLNTPDSLSAVRGLHSSTYVSVLIAALIVDGDFASGDDTARDRSLHLYAVADRLGEKRRGIERAAVTVADRRRRCIDRDAEYREVRRGPRRERSLDDHRCTRGFALEACGKDL